MPDFNTIFQTISALGSMFAAIAALCVSKSVFSFQRNTIVKQATSDQIRKLLTQLYYLKSLTGQAALDAEDDTIVGLASHIADTKASVAVLGAMMTVQESPDTRKVREIISDLHEGNVFAQDQTKPNTSVSMQLDDAISSLQSIYRSEMK